MKSTYAIEILLAKATQQLTQQGSESPAIDAAVLLCHAINKPRSYLFTWPERSITEQEFAAFKQILDRRLAGEPVAYIVGQREFWSLPLAVAPSTLIPRPDTERLVEIALEKAEQIDGDILDLGTGTGAIALAMASELPSRLVRGIDFQSDAVKLAQYNAQQLNIQNCDFHQSSWFENIDLGTKFAVIVSNPPYIDANDPHLTQGDVRFEPLTALVAEDHGLADIRHISEMARQYLHLGGWLLFEHGFEQGDAVRQILVSLNYEEVETAQDYSGLDRVTFGKFKG